MKDVMMAIGGGLNHGLKFREAKEAGRIGLKQLVAEGFGRKWYSVGVVEQDGVGVRILRVGGQRCRLFEMVFRCQVRIGQIRMTAAVSDGYRLQHVAEHIDRERYGVGHPRVGDHVLHDLVKLALVVEIDSLARMREEYAIAVRSL